MISDPQSNYLRPPTPHLLKMVSRLRLGEHQLSTGAPAWSLFNMGAIREPSSVKMLAVKYLTEW